MEFSKSDIFHYDSPKVIDQPITESNRRHISFTNKVFTVSIVDDNSMAYSDPSIFKLVAKNVFLKSSEEGGYEANFLTEEKELHLCNKADFPSNDVFYNLGLKNSYCLDNNTFEMQGYWDEPYLSYFSLELYLCDNKTSNFTCKTRDEINEFFVMKYFNLVYAGLRIDVKNYRTPLATKYRNDFQLVDPNLNKMMNIFFKPVIVKTEDGLIFSKETEVQDIDFDFSETDFSFIHSNLNLSAAIFVCDFYSSKHIQSISRTYQKISEVFANIGGLLSFLMLWGFVLTYVENTLSLKIKIMNRLYSFQPEKPKKATTNTELKLINSAEKPLNNPPKICTNNNINENNFFLENKEQNKEQILEKDNQINIKFSTTSLEFCLNKKHIDVKLEPKKLEDDELIEILSPEIRKKSKTQPDLSEKPEPLGKISENQFSNRKPQIELESMKKSGLSNSGLNVRKSKRKNSSILYPTEKKLEMIEQFKQFQGERNNNLKVSLFEYFKLKIRNSCNFFHKTFNEKLFAKAEKIYEKEVDIVYILQRLQEIDKLKMILLTEEQIALFNLSAKPMIYNERDMSKEERGEHNITDVFSATKKEKIMKPALNSIEKQAQKGILNPIDKRLYDLLDKDYKNFKNFFNESE